MSFVQWLPFFIHASWSCSPCVCCAAMPSVGAMHSLIWGIGLTMYGIGTLAEVLLAMTYSPVILPAVVFVRRDLTPAWLGQGTVHLLVRRKRVANTLLVILIIASVIATIHRLARRQRSFRRSSASSQHSHVSAKYKDVMPRDTFTAYLLAPSRCTAPSRWWAARCIRPTFSCASASCRSACWAMSSSRSAACRRRWAAPWPRAARGDYLFASELIGAVLIFIGFRLATAQQPVPAPPAPAQVAPAA